ncbi:protein kinase domain-containing protein [Nonomuraea candida]|uniref:protein kinase domain-containing protein n=1 Tax=Nonomuraea candida TaxID=359159 RepID=UPI0006950C88|nr:transporter substrate-binding domain-containing protein [Nonomuraea candida]
MPQISPLVAGDPSELGSFRLSGRIGEGGQGIVYLGVNDDGERAAIKLLHVKFSGDTIARSRFARELRAAKRVASFCTARVMEADLDGDTPYIASEYIDGRPLREVVESDGPLTGTALHRLAIGTATALTAIHHASIVHRDFKPDNVLIAADGPRVVDFGIARIIDSTGTITSRAIGTPAYMAPEQIAGDEIGPYTDVFSWGATISFAATGKVAFEGKSIATVLNRILNHEVDVDMMEEPLRGVVREALAKSPAERPSADQILLRLLGQSSAVGASTAVLTKGVQVAGDEDTTPFLRVSPRSLTGQQARTGPGASPRPGATGPAAAPASGPAPAASGGAAGSGTSAAPGTGPAPDVTGPEQYRTTDQEQPGTTGQGQHGNTGQSRHGNTGQGRQDRQHTLGRQAVTTPPAPAGPHGSTGPQGSTGQHGSTGPQGSTGQHGSMGAHGSTGPHGVATGPGSGPVPAAGDGAPYPEHEPAGRRRRAKVWLALATSLALVAAAAVALLVKNGWQGLPFGDGAGPGSEKSPPAALSTVVDRVASTGKIVIGVKGDLPGVGLQNGDDFQGFDVDIARRIAAELGAERTTLVRVSRDDRDDALAEGKVDLVVATYSVDRSKVTFAGPYYLAHQDVLVRAGTGIDELGDLKGKRICAPNSPSVGLVQDRVAVKPVVAGDYAACMDLLRNGKVDAVPGDDLILAGFAAREHMRYKVLGAKLTNERYAVGIKAGDVKTCKAVSGVIADLYAKGFVAELMTRHFGKVDFEEELKVPAMETC